MCGSFDWCKQDVDDLIVHKATKLINNVVLHNPGLSIWLILVLLLIIVFEGKRVEDQIGDFSLTLIVIAMLMWMR